MYDFNEMCRSCFKLTVYRINATMICHNFSLQHFMICIYSKIHNDLKTNLGNGAGTVRVEWLICGVFDVLPKSFSLTQPAMSFWKLICPVFVRPFQIGHRTVVFVVSFIVTVSYKDNALDDGSRRAMNVIVLYEYRWDVNKIKHNSNKRVGGGGVDRELFKTGVWWHVGRFVICVRWFSTHLSP